MRRRLILAVIFLLTIAGAAFVLYRAVTDNKGNYRFTNGTAVVKELQELSRFETAAFTIEKIIEAGTDENRFREILFGDRILLVAHGQVVAGFDLSELDNDSVSVSGDKVTLDLPPPQILFTDLDNEKTRVYDRQQGILARGDRDLESEARMEAERQIREAACSGAILQEASENARKQLTALMGAFGFSEVEINIPNGDCS